MIHDCLNGKECVSTSTDNSLIIGDPEWLESEVVAGYKIWQIMFFSGAGFLTLVILLCCCIRFRIPRTKQEIEADYVRKKITKKFKKQLKMIHNSDMDEMDLKRALDRIRAEFKSDTESLAQSEALSGATLSSCNFQLPGEVDNVGKGQPRTGAVRKHSDLGITFDELVAKEQRRRDGKFSLSGMMTKLKSNKNKTTVDENEKI